MNASINTSHAKAPRAPRRADPQRGLCTAIKAMFAQDAASISNFISTPWWSATFAGARHEFILTIDGDDHAIAAFIATIGEHDFALGGHLVADVVAHVKPSDAIPQIHIEALTIETS